MPPLPKIGTCPIIDGRLGGLREATACAQKLPYVTQALADVLGLPIDVHCSEQTCAAGAAMCASGVTPGTEPWRLTRRRAPTATKGAEPRSRHRDKSAPRYTYGLCC